MEKDDKMQQKPDYVFEVSWEVCNKLGGIYSAVSTKAPLMNEKFGDHFIMIGPILYKGEGGNREFLEDTEPFKTWKDQCNVDGIKFRVGRWDIPGKPIVILIDFSPLFIKKDQIFSTLWTKNRLDSLLGWWNYIEPAMFGVGLAMVIESFRWFYVHTDQHALAHFYKWMTGAGVLYLVNSVDQVATVLTTHTTFTGSGLCGGGKPFYSQFETYNGDQVAKIFDVTVQHSFEKTASISADAFTT